MTSWKNTFAKIIHGIEIFSHGREKGNLGSLSGNYKTMKCVKLDLVCFLGHITFYRLDRESKRVFKLVFKMINRFQIYIYAV